MIFFTKNPNLKKEFFFFGGGGWGWGAGVSEFFYFESKLEIKKNNSLFDFFFFFFFLWGGGGSGGGLEYVDSFFTKNPNLKLNVLNGTSSRRQLCKIILKSMHKCTSYGPDKLNL